MLKRILPLLMLATAYSFGAPQTEEEQYPPKNPPTENEEGDVADRQNLYEYNLYDREQNKRDQQQRQQYYYQQSQGGNNSPQYNRTQSPKSQYFSPRDE